MSITDVASLAGVSTATVSRVINRSPSVKPEMVRAVQEAMKRLGYNPPLRRRGPKPAARRGIRTGNVALLAMGNDSLNLYRLPVFPKLVHGIETALAEQGLNLVLASIKEDGVLPPALLGNQLDGVLLLNRLRTVPAELRQRLANLPAVWVMREHADDEGRFDHVFYNNANVSRIAAKYLLDRGHTRAAFLNGAPSHTAFGQRQRDFSTVMAGSDATVQEFVVAPAAGAPPVSTVSWEAAAVQFARSADRPTGLFIPSDTYVAAVYRALEAEGVRPGRDVEVISCDNEEPFLAHVSPRPATIDLNLEQVARKGVQQLLWRLRNADEENRVTVLIEPTLVLPT
jgi:LacI family transcriptional regulator